MAEVDQEILIELIKSIRSLRGANSSSEGNTFGNSRHIDYNEKLFHLQKKSGIKHVHDITHGLMGAMHGGGFGPLISSVGHLTKGFLGLGAGVTILATLFASAMKMNTTFGKMTDIGQNFGGSMFNMMKEAGAAGLSLEDFHTLLARNSTLTAMMNDTVVTTTGALGALQHTSRATGALGDHYAATGEAASDLHVALSDATAAANKMISQQDASLGVSSIMLASRFTGLSDVTADNVRQLAAMGGAAGLFTADLSQSAAETTRQQQAMASSTDLLRQQVTVTSNSFTNLTAQQIASNLAAESFNRRTMVAPRAATDPLTPLAGTFARLGASTSGVIGVQNSLMALSDKTNIELDQFSGSLVNGSIATDASNRVIKSFNSVTNDASKTIENNNDVQNRANRLGENRNIQEAKTTALGVKAGVTQRQTLAQLQLGVRDSLKDVGFYGMSLADLTGATSDYMETIRQSGMLYKLDDNERINAVKGMIGQASEMAIVWGKSRDLIIKTTNASMQQTNLAASLIGADKSRVKAIQESITMLAAIPGETGDKLAKMFAEQAGRGGYVDTEMGKGFIDTGMGHINTIFGELEAQANKGVGPSPEKSAEAMGEMYDSLMANRDRLEALSHSGGEAAGAAMVQLKILTDMQGKFVDVNTGKLDRQKLIAAQIQAKKEKDINDMLTRNMSVFTSTVSQVTGGFIEGFYGAFAKLMGGGDQKALDAAMKKLHDMFEKLGSAMGSMLGILLRPGSMSVLSVLFDWLGKFIDLISILVKGIGAAASWIDGLFGKPKQVAVLDEQGHPKIDEQGKPMMKNDDSSVPPSAVIGAIATIAFLWFIKNGMGRLGSIFKGSLMSLGKKDVKGEKDGVAGKIAGLVTGGGECCEGMASTIADGVAKGTEITKSGTAALGDVEKKAGEGATKKGILKRTGGAVLGAGKKLLRSPIKTGIAGMVLGTAADMAIDHIPEKTKGRETLKSVVDLGMTGATVGAMIGTAFFGVGAVPGAAIGGLVGAIAGAISANLPSDEDKKAAAEKAKAAADVKPPDATSVPLGPSIFQKEDRINPNGDGKGDPYESYMSDNARVSLNELMVKRQNDAAANDTAGVASDDKLIEILKELLSVTVKSTEALKDNNSITQNNALMISAYN